ncbi:MAG TPA: serine hydrolase domain-containing protein [Gemmatimonadaceae bacterium]|nr:serine hydrolase domain-containing protein [Gemmatimonadaceae bacterium]
MRRHIPELPNYPFPVRIKHLVYMTSGLPDYFTVPRGGGKSWADPFTNSDAIAATLRSGRLRFRPGTQWAYSNVNYMLLAEIVARRSGVPFGEFAQREIFGPLGMTSSRFHTDMAMTIDNPVVGYNLRGHAYVTEPRQSPHYGGSGLFTSVKDLARWSASLETHALGGPGLTAVMLSTRRFKHDKTNDAFGLVWGRYRSFRTLWYDGGDAGFSSHTVRLHDVGLTVIVLSNLGTGGAAARARKILDALFAPL